MATSSILKNINIEDKKTAQSFVTALENSKNRSGKEMTIKKACIDIKRSQIKSIFGVKSE